MDKRIHTQGNLYDELRHISERDRALFQLHHRDDAIYLGPVDASAQTEGLRLDQYNNRQLVIAMRLMQQQIPLTDIRRQILSEQDSRP